MRVSRKLTAFVAIALLAPALLWVGNRGLRVYLTEPETALELKWPDLIPNQDEPAKILVRFLEKYGNLPNDDPRIDELQKELAAARDATQVNDELDNKRVRIPGYILPLEGDGTRSTEFLLVPHYGACIIVPAPPPNQLVYVKTADPGGVTVRKLFDLVWVTGTIQTRNYGSALGEAGYTLVATQVIPY